MTGRPLTVTMSVMLLAVGIGCGNDPAAQQAETDIRAVLAQFQQSLETGDANQFVSCLRGRQEELAAARSAFAFWQASYAFRDAYRDAFGRRAWASLQSSKARLRVPPRDPGFWRRLDVIVKGDRARIERELDIRLFRLHRRDGRWRLDAGDFVPSGADPAVVAEASRTMARLVRDQACRIGQPGVTAQGIADALAEAFRRELDALSADESPASPANEGIDHEP